MLRGVLAIRPIGGGPNASRSCAFSPRKSKGGRRARPVSGFAAGVWRELGDGARFPAHAGRSIASPAGGARSRAISQAAIATFRTLNPNAARIEAV